MAYRPASNQMLRIEESNLEYKTQKNDYSVTSFRERRLSQNSDAESCNFLFGEYSTGGYNGDKHTMQYERKILN